MAISDKLTYLNTTKQRLKDSINALGGDLDSEDTFRSYAEELDNIYDKLPKVTGTGSNISLTPTLKGALGTIPLGNCEQDTYTGKNKFNVNALTSGGIITVSDDKITIANNTNTNGAINTQIKLSDYCPTLQVGDIVTLTFNTTTQNSTNKNIFYILTANVSWTNNTSITITQDMLNGNIVMYGGYNETSVISNIMVRYTSVTDNTYEPYVGGIPSPNPSYPQDIKVVTGDNSVVVCNKNLFDKTKVKQNRRVNSNDGTIGIMSQLCCSDYIALTNTNSLYLSGNTTSQSRTSYLCAFYDTNKNYISGINCSLNQPFPNRQIDIPNNAKYIIFNCEVTDLDTIMLEVGSTPTNYVAHQEQTYTLHLGNEYLASIPNTDYKDEIDVVNKKIIRKVGKDNQKQFTGGNVDTSVFYIPFDERATTTDTNQVLYCNKLFFNGNYINLTNAKTYMQDYQIAVNNNGTSKNIFIKNSNYDNVSDFRNWLNSLNFTWYYQLTTPTEETITDTTLINELNGLQELLSYDGTTNITITSDNSNAQMTAQVSALKGE